MNALLSNELTTDEQSVIERLIAALGADRADVSVYGQGSRLLGLVPAGSDLDVVVVWPGGSQLRPLLDASRRHPIAPDHLLEVASDLAVPTDVVHMTRERLLLDVETVEGGQGWQSDAWPSPVVTVSGLAAGRVLHDESGWLAEAQGRLAHVTQQYRLAVNEATSRHATVYVREIAKAQAAGHGWLVQKLTVELMRTLYASIFLRHDAYAPFPKHLGAWFERLGVDADIRAAEALVWAPEGPLPGLERLAALLVSPG